MTAHLPLIVTGGLLTLLLLLGLSLQLGWRRDQARWPHHALFFLVCAALLVSVLLVWREGGRWWGLLPALLALLSMPRTRPGRANHWQRALLVGLAYLLGVSLAW